MAKSIQRFHQHRGRLLVLAAALALLAGTAPETWAQKSKSGSSSSGKSASSRSSGSSSSSSARSSGSRSSGSRSSSTVRSAPRSSGSRSSGSRSSTVRSAPRSTVRSAPPSTVRSTPPRSSGVSPSRPSTSPPRSGYRSGPAPGSRYDKAGKGTDVPTSGYRSGPTPGPRYDGVPRTGYSTGPTPGPRYQPRDRPGGDGGGDSSGGHHHGSGHHHGHGYYGYYGYYSHSYYPYFWGSRYYRPYYYFGLGYGYYPYAYPYYPRGRVVSVEVQGALDLNVKPKDTQVYLNGYYIGTTGDFDGWPRYLWLDEDTHELIFFKEGYETVVRELAIQPDAVINVKFRMEPGPSTPAEELSRYKDRDSRDRSYASGRDTREYRYRDSREPEYRDSDRGERMYDERTYDDRGSRPPQDRPLPAPSGEPEIDLRTEAGRFVLTVTPPEASVYIDGRFVGIGGELTQMAVGLLMDPGEHRLQVFHPDYETREKTFEVEAGKETKLGVDLSTPP